MIKHLLETRADDLINEIDHFVLMCEEANMINEQWYLNFEDVINAYSVRDHNNIKK